MENSSSDLLDALLAASAALSVAGAAVVGALRWSARGRICAVRHLQRSSSRHLSATLLLVALAAAAVASQWEHLNGPLALAALAGAAATAWWSPSSRDSALGESGVRRGWHARRFEELEEWRLTGEHLRWKLLGEWQASPAPPDEHAELRAKLEQRCPGRESRFSA